MSNNVFQKLQLARLLLQEKKLTKSGKNKFAGYEYFELQDFLPTVQTIFADTGLCAVFRCDDGGASLTVYNTENPEQEIVFTAPMAAAELKGCHPVQNLGASISYLRRYLYVNALEIVEHDALDATTGKEPVKAEPKPVPKPEAKPTTVDGTAIVKGTNLPNKDWGIKISSPVGTDGWMNMVELATDTCLGLAETQADVMTIYKHNKSLFEEVKAADPDFFKGLLEKFSARKGALA